MEENEFRKSYRELAHRPCVFQKAILSGRYSCAFVEKINIAEREAISCQYAERASECHALIKILEMKMRFAVHKQSNHAVTHAQGMKVQLGGLGALKSLLSMDSSAIDQLLDGLRAQYSDFEDLPFDMIVRELVHFKLR